jgi:hypothetical protein
MPVASDWGSSLNDAAASAALHSEFSNAGKPSLAMPEGMVNRGLSAELFRRSWVL